MDGSELRLHLPCLPFRLLLRVVRVDYLPLRFQPVAQSMGGVLFLQLYMDGTGVAIRIR